MNIVGVTENAGVENAGASKMGGNRGEKPVWRAEIPVL